MNELGRFKKNDINDSIQIGFEPVLNFEFLVNGQQAFIF